MAYIEPNTEAYFCKEVPLDPNYENTIYFSSQREQYNYFRSKAVEGMEKMTYQRKTRGWIRVGWSSDYHAFSVINSMYNVNYMMFKNDSFENKWFYAFVDKVEYVNNNCVDVQYHIDVLQTWHFDYALNQCFIERQHTVTDNPGQHTVPEQIEHGPYIDELAQFDMDGVRETSGRFRYTPCICIALTFDPNEDSDIPIPTLDAGVVTGMFPEGSVFNGCYYIAVPANAVWGRVLMDILNGLASDNKKDSVVGIFMFPSNLNPINNNGQQVVKTLNFIHYNTLGNYIPRNKKLLTNPYIKMYVSNNCGIASEYNLEDFYDNPIFKITANMNPGGGLLLWPTTYKEISGDNFDEAIQLNGFPPCAWTYDAFQAWLAQNAGTIVASAMGLMMGWATAIGRTAVGDPSAIASMPNLMAGTLMATGQVYDHATKPPQLSGNNNVTITASTGLSTYSFYIKHIKLEYARIIDSYFDMYGYKVNTVGVPNRTARRSYTYIKTIGCTINGSVPADDTKEIEKIYDNGIRYWKYRPDLAIGNYDSAVNPNTVE